MNVCSLLTSKNRISYSYYHRGLRTPFLPDHMPETHSSNFYTAEDGQLFLQKDIAWYGTSVLFDGVDICFQLNDPYFIDHINFVFSDNTEVESIEILTVISGTYKKIGFVGCETNGSLKAQNICVPIGFSCENLVVRLNGCCKPIHIKCMEILAVKDIQNAVWPLPSSGKISDTAFPLSSFKTIQATGEDVVFAARYLQEMLLELHDHPISLCDTEGDIRLCLTEKSENEEAYELITQSNTCTIRASGRKGLLYAVCTLMQLTDGKIVKEANIQDTPFMDLRAIHIALPPRNQIAFLKKLIKYTLVPMHYNALILQISGAMRYDRYPEINEKWVECCEKYEKGQWPKIHHYGFIGRDILEKSEVRDLCGFMRDYGLEVIPEIQAWAHTQYITVAYPELAEKSKEEQTHTIVDLNVQDMRPADFYPHTMCPLHEKYYEVIFGITDEVLEVVQPERFVNMGHDEIYHVGICPRCAQIPRESLYSQEVHALHDYLRAKNLKMMIYADMLQEHVGYSIPGAIEQIPKDIILIDFTWYFSLDKNTEEHLLSHGFPVLIGNLYSSHYPRYELRTKNDGILGGAVSTWKPCNEKSYAYFGKLFDFVYTANMMWNQSYRSDMRISYNEIIKPVMERMRIALGNIKNTGSRKHLLLSGSPLQLPYDLRGMSDYESALSVGLHAPEKIIAVHDYAALLSFVHATDRKSVKPLNKNPIKIGEYVICYDDQTEYVEKLMYAENIYTYHSSYGDRFTSVLFRHQGYAGTYLTFPKCGKTTEGLDYTLGEYRFRNPFPDKKISKIIIKHCQNTDASILVFDSYITKYE